MKKTLLFALALAVIPSLVRVLRDLHALLLA